MGIERIALEPGEYDVRVSIGDSPDPTEWRFVTEARQRFEGDARRVVTFESAEGFRWH